MYRVVFCPHQDSYDEALSIAEEWQLPIQIGDSDRTKDLDFDRSRVSTISVPIVRGFSVEQGKDLKLMSTYQVVYQNDFINCKNVKISAEKDGKEWEISKFQRDPHTIICVVSAKVPGIYTLLAKLNNELLDSEALEVKDYTREI